MRDLIASRWNEIEPLLDALLELPPEQRAVELERRCHDPELRAAASQLLAFDARDGSGVDQIAREISAHAGGLEGQRIGPYPIERTLGEGGMGGSFWPRGKLRNSPGRSRSSCCASACSARRNKNNSGANSAFRGGAGPESVPLAHALQQLGISPTAAELSTTTTPFR